MFSKNKTGAPKEAPEATLEKKKARKAKRRRLLRKLGRGTLWTLAIGFVLHTSLNIYATVMLNREFAAIRAKGQPIQFAEIEPAAVPDFQNAWLVYEQATKALKLTSQEKYALNRREKQLTAQDKQLIEAALHKNRESVELIRQAAAMPKCRFPLEWKGDPTRFRFPYYSELRTLTRLLAVQATLEANKGDIEASLRDTGAIWGINRHLSSEPYMIGFLVALSIDISGHRTLGHNLEKIPLTVKQAQALEASFPRTDWEQGFHQSLMGERMMGIFAFQSFQGQGNSSQVDEKDWDDEDSESVSMPVFLSYPVLWFWRPFLKLDQIEMLRMWTKLIDSPKARQIPRPAGFGMEQEKAVMNAPFYAIMTKLLFPVFTRSGDNRDFAEVRRRQREVALALTCYRTLHGAYPVSLKEAQKLWGKPLPTDPYSQKPFNYKREGNSFLLYSIGVNRTDDKGAGPYSNGYRSITNTDDIIWLNSRSGM